MTITEISVQLLTTYGGLLLVQANIEELEISMLRLIRLITAFSTVFFALTTVSMAQVAPGPKVIFTHPGPISGLDGSGNHVDLVNNIVFSMERQYTTNNNTVTAFTFDMEFYNGSGTWHGAHSLNIDLVNSKGEVVTNTPVYSYNLLNPRTECVYGHSKPYHDQGILAFDFTGKDVQSIKVSITPLMGNQSPC